MATKKEIKERLVNELVEEFTSKGVNLSRVKRSGTDLVVLKKDDEEISTVDLGIFAETVKTYPSMQEVLTSAMKTSLAECLKRFDEIEEDDDIDEDGESFEDIEIEIDDDEEDEDELNLQNIIPITIPDVLLPEMAGAYIYKVGAVSIGFIDSNTEDMIRKEQVVNKDELFAQAMRNIAREQVKISSFAEKVSTMFMEFGDIQWVVSHADDFNSIYVVEVPTTSPICYKENILARIAEIVGGCYVFVPLANGMVICSDSKLAPVFDRVSELYMQKDFKEYGFCVSHKWSFYSPEDEAVFVL